MSIRAAKTKTLKGEPLENADILRIGQSVRKPDRDFEYSGTRIAVYGV